MSKAQLIWSILYPIFSTGFGRLRLPLVLLVLGVGLTVERGEYFLLTCITEERTCGRDSRHVQLSWLACRLIGEICAALRRYLEQNIGRAADIETRRIGSSHIFRVSEDFRRRYGATFLQSRMRDGGNCVGSLLGAVIETFETTLRIASVLWSISKDCDHRYSAVFFPALILDACLELRSRSWVYHAKIVERNAADGQLFNEAIQNWREIASMNMEDATVSELVESLVRSCKVSCDAIWSGELDTLRASMLEHADIFVRIVLSSRANNLLLDFWISRKHWSTLRKAISKLCQQYRRFGPDGEIWTEIDLLHQIVTDARSAEDSVDVKDLQVNSGHIAMQDSDLFHHTPYRRLDARRGELILLMGRSGVGKTTLFRSLLRFCPVSRGRIMIDCQDIAHSTRRSLREQISVVWREPNLFARNVLENVQFGRPQASQDQIKQCCRFAQIDEDIMSWPQQYRTNIAPAAANISSGQKIRLALARALLREPKIILLDEVTSSLDDDTRDSVWSTLRTVSQTTTILIISHNALDKGHADKVYHIKGANEYQ